MILPESFSICFPSLGSILNFEKGVYNVLFRLISIFYLFVEIVGGILEITVELSIIGDDLYPFCYHSLRRGV